MTTDAPDYPIGHTINLVAQVCVALLAIFGILYVVRENKLRDKGSQAGGHRRGEAGRAGLPPP
jgi:hypothetical protein